MTEKNIIRKNILILKNQKKLKFKKYSQYILLKVYKNLKIALNQGFLPFIKFYIK